VLKTLFCLGLLVPCFACANITIALIGDSITTGFGVEIEETYSALLKRNIKECGYDVKFMNYSMGGNQTSIALKMAKKLFEREKPNIVIIALGINDAYAQVSPVVIQSHLEQIIQTCLFHQAKVVLGMIDLSGLPGFQPSYQLAFNGIYSSLMTNYPISSFHFLDRSLLAIPYQNNIGDRHPDAQGHWIIFQNLKDLVLAILND
jgi:acyl-CoA thioesterase-1